MTKTRKICRGDIVKYHSYEWVVKRKRNDMVNLVRRQVDTGPSIWVPVSRIKHADQSWRHTLAAGDPVSLYLGGYWVKARVFRREGNNLCVQPSFTNFTIRIKDSSGHIARTTHDFPLWEEDVNRLVMHQGEIHMERGPGLLYPWTYASGIPVNQKKPIFITKIEFKPVYTTGLPMTMYNQMSTDEIMHDVYNTFTHGMPSVLSDIADQYVHHRLPRYHIESQNIDIYAAQALDHHDTRRVSELLSVGNNTSVWNQNEHAIYCHFSRPYLEPKISYDSTLDLVTVELYWTGIRLPMVRSLKSILGHISTPMKYEPAIVEVQHSPEISYALSRMLGMELEPLEKLYLRHVNQHWLTLDRGFCRKTMNRYGGVVLIPGIDFTMLTRELVKRSPMKTLVVVEKDTMPMWKKFPQWHGRKREDGNIVVTTRSTLIRSWTLLQGFQRLICIAIPNAGTVYHEVICGMPCKVRWAFCSKISCVGAFHIFGLPNRNRASVQLSRVDMERMGVIFPVKSVQKIMCKTKHAQANVIRNTVFLPYSKKKEMISKYLLKPSLVPAYIRGEKLDSYNGTIDSIATNFKLDKNILKERVKETCAVCLEKIHNPAVTQCGHVFCATCAAELDKRNINCAMCRSKIKGFMRVSDEDTPGKIVMHKGSCYRVDDDSSWGSKYSVLKEHTDATFVTQYSSVKKALEKAFPKTKVVTRKAIDNGLRVKTSKVVMVEPEPVPDFDYAWGKDLEIISLCYTVKV